MPVRIVHTADVHLDGAFAGLGAEKGRRKRRAIRDVFRKIVDAAKDLPADALVIAGDLFEAARVTPDTIGFLKAEFARLDPIAVVIAPGNHDPFVDSGPYAVTRWSPNVHIFKGREAETFSLKAAGLTFVGVAHTSTHMEGRLVDIVPKAPGDSANCVLVAHASLQGPGIAEKAADDIWLPFAPEELAVLNYHYSALGHYHNGREVSHGGRLVGAYPGAPEGLSFSETGKRRCLKVELADGRASVTPVPTSEIDFLNFEVPCDNYGSREEFFEALRHLEVRHEGDVIARVTATGQVAPGFALTGEAPTEIERLFFHLKVVDETVPAYDWVEIVKEESLRGEVARILDERLAGASEEEKSMLELARLLAADALEGRAIELPPEVTRVD
ncbi:MAG: metallophosphoesterase family protein [Planctomycetota bacterium]|jgi:DNA repair exonuclease SbcCD nuclease subunit